MQVDQLRDQSYAARQAQAVPYRSTGVRLFVLLTLLLTGPVVMALEEPKFEIIASFDGVEIRRYAPYVVAEVDVADDSSGFRKLAGYIFGGNEQGEKMAMTAPVESRQSELQDKTTYSFVMEHKYTLDTLPTPDDEEIRLLERPERVVAVLRFSGRWTDKNFGNHRDKLLQALERNSISPAGPAEQARYNSPFTPSFLRRNEVLIPVEWSKDPS
ncbi:MAG: heme-binding protein [Woeseiaceae bacterium]